MSNFTISAIGKFKPGAELELYHNYEKRIKWKISLKEFEIKHNLSCEIRKNEEAKLLLSACNKADIIIALDEKGKTLSSQELANYLQENMLKGNSNIAFIIGGADGLHETIKQKSNLVLSFGRLTFPHLLVRGLLVEQIYRSQTIINNHPYHRE